MTRAYVANVEESFRQKFCVREAKKAFFDVSKEEMVFREKIAPTDANVRL